MNQTFTHNDLLLLIYGELDYCSEVAIKKEILQNDSLAKEFRELKSAISIMTANEIAPKQSTVLKVLQQSKKSQVEFIS